MDEEVAGILSSACRIFKPRFDLTNPFRGWKYASVSATTARLELKLKLFFGSKGILQQKPSRVLSSEHFLPTDDCRLSSARPLESGRPRVVEGGHIHGSPAPPRPLVRSRMQLTLHATRRTPHDASRLMQGIPAWSMKTRRAPSRHRRDARG